MLNKNWQYLSIHKFFSPTEAREILIKEHWIALPCIWSQIIGFENTSSCVLTWASWCIFHIQDTFPIQSLSVAITENQQYWPCDIAISPMSIVAQGIPCKDRRWEAHQSTGVDMCQVSWRILAGGRRNLWCPLWRSNKLSRQEGSRLSQQLQGPLHLSF